MTAVAPFIDSSRNQGFGAWHDAELTVANSRVRFSVNGTQLLIIHFVKDLIQASANVT
jgi:hypothetical protein